MASYHLSIKHGGVGSGRPHADYICREGKYASEKLKEQLVYKETGNLPGFVSKNDVLDYWSAADEYTRLNGRTYDEFELALPAELSNEDNIKLVQQFVKNEIDPNCTYTFAIHDKMAANDSSQRQIHAHIMFSPKVQDGIERSREQFFKRYNSKTPERGGAANNMRFSTFLANDEIEGVRLRWQNAVNREYEKRGLTCRVSCKSLADQYAEAVVSGDKEKMILLNRDAQVHLGVSLTYTSLREAAKYVNPADYYLKEAHPKARHNFIVCMQLQTAKDKIILLRERALTQAETLTMKAGDKELVKDLKTQLLDNTEAQNRKEAAANLDEELAKKATVSKYELQLAIKELKTFRSQYENFVFSDKKIKEMANDIYTKGKTKTIRAQYKNMLSEKESITKAIEKFKELKASGTLSPEAEAEQRAKLMERRNTFLAKEQELKAEIAKMQRSLGTEKAVKAVADIEAAIRARVEITQQRIQDRKDRIDNLRAQSVVLDDARASVKSIAAFENEKEKSYKRLTNVATNIEAIKSITGDPYKRMKYIRYQDKYLTAQIARLERKQRTLKRFILKPEYIDNAAKSIYSHGLSKKYTLELHKMERLKAELAKNPADDTLKGKIKELEASLLEKKTRLTELFNNPNAAETLDRIRNSRLSKNYILENRLTIVAEEIYTLKHLKEELEVVRDDTAKEITHKQEKSHEQSRAGNTISAISKGLKELISMPEAHSLGGMNARLDKADRIKKEKGMSLSSDDL